MFREWGFLLGEIWVLILLAALLGLFVGWLLWGRRAAAMSAELDAGRYALKEKQTRLSAKEEEMHRLRAKQSTYIADLNEELEGRDQKIANLTGQIHHAKPDGSGEIVSMREAHNREARQASERKASPTARTETEARDAQEARRVASMIAGAMGRGSADAAKPTPKPAPISAVAGQDFDGDGIIEGTNEGSKPAVLSAARNGQADDLKQIKGVGPKLEGLLNSLGFYHFDQVASWGKAEVAWVDANLEGFSGRVSRDAWVAQAKVLASGGQTEFAKRVDDGGVY